MGSGVLVVEVLGGGRRWRGKAELLADAGDNGSNLAIGLAINFSRKREYSLGPWRSSIATAGDPRRSMTFCTRERISTRVSCVR